VILTASGVFTYTHDGSETTSDSFVYEVCDDGTPSECDTAAVTVTVNPVNDPPDAVGDTANTPENIAVAIAVLDNDSDVDGALDPSTITVTVPAAHGSTLVDLVTGVITYTPDLDWDGADGFVYQICDDGSPLPAACDTATVNITVEADTFTVFAPVVLSNYSGVDLRPVGPIEVYDDGNGGYEVRVVLENAGEYAVTADFWVDLYVDPTSAVGVNVLWTDVCTFGKAWYVRDDLAPGAMIVLSTNDPDDPASPGDRYSNWPGTFTPGTHEIWAVVDSYGLSGIGAVIETDESNNVSGPRSISASSTFSSDTEPPPLDPRPTPIW
jgi:hypothetical protein